MTGTRPDGLFGALFGRGAGQTGDQAWLQAMLDTEAALARAAERAGLAKPGSGAAVTAVARAELIDAAAIANAAAGPANPVPALVKALTELLPADQADAAGAIHRGATSQDIIDTAAMLVAKRSLRATEADLRNAANACATLAEQHAGTVMSGRTLLQQAVPVTFGLVAAGWLTGIDEARRELRRIATTRLAAQFGGAAGTLAALGESGPTVAALLATELGLTAPVLPWHTDRQRIIQLAAALAGACAALGKVGRDVTLLAQTEVAEVHEGGTGRGGSSAMPHKQNPVASIVVLGCAKQAPGLLATLAAAAEQEHQRAAGAWHAEWLPLSDLLALTGSAAAWSADLLAGLRPDPARMRANLDATGGLPLAENVTSLLAPSLGRLQAHDLVAAAARRAAERGIGLADALLDEDQGAELPAQANVGRSELAEVLNPEAYLGASSAFVRAALAAHATSAAEFTGTETAK